VTVLSGKTDTLVSRLLIFFAKCCKNRSAYSLMRGVHGIAEDDASAREMAAAILFDEAKGAGRSNRSAQPQAHSAQPPKLWADDSNPLRHPWLSATQEDKGV